MIKSRSYNNDYNRIMDFLRIIYLQTKTQQCWLPQRWEYAEHLCNPLYIERGWDDWKKYIRIWEDKDKIVGICHKETSFDTFLQIRPGYEFLAQEMIVYAEENIPKQDENREKSITIYAPKSKKYLQHILMERDYKKGDACSYFNVQRLDKEYTPNLPKGYKFVNALDITNQLRRYNAVNTGFHPEKELSKVVTKSFASMENAPLFKNELEIMTQYEDGTLSSFCVVWYDEILKIGMFEPVCTNINHRKKGIGRAMIIEGLRVLKQMGATHAYVESYGDNRKAFYNSAGFESFDEDWPWTKQW